MAADTLLPLVLNGLSTYEQETGCYLGADQQNSVPTGWRPPSPYLAMCVGDGWMVGRFEEVGRSEVTF